MTLGWSRFFSSSEVVILNSRIFFQSWCWISHLLNETRFGSPRLRNSVTISFYECKHTHVYLPSDKANESALNDILQNWSNWKVSSTKYRSRVAKGVIYRRHEHQRRFGILLWAILELLAPHSIKTSENMPVSAVINEITKSRGCSILILFAHLIVTRVLFGLGTLCSVLFSILSATTPCATASILSLLQ